MNLKKQIVIATILILLSSWNLCWADRESNTVKLLEAESIFDVNVLAAYDISKGILQTLRDEKDTLNLAKAYYLLGMSYYVMNNPDKSHLYHDSSRIEYTKLNDTSKVYELLVISAKIAREAGEYEAAQAYLDILFNTQLPENHKAYYSAATSEKALIYEEMGLISEAETEFNKALDFNKANDFKSSYARNLLDLARVYRMQLRNDAVIEILREADAQFRYLADRDGLAETYLIWGEVAYDIGDIETAKDKLQKAETILVEISNLTMLKEVLYALYLLELKNENISQALVYLDNYSKILSEEIKSSSMLGEINKRLNLERTKRSISQDKLSEIELAKSNMELQMKLKESELKNQSQTIFYISLFLGLFIIILVILFILFGSKKKSNALLEEKNLKLESVNELLNNQNQTIVEQTERIMDSINYGLTIQNAMLPSATYIKELFSENFVFFKPKDVVSGDFYWFKKVGGIRFAAVIDCTGHGVPGAFMSMIGNTLLNEIVVNDLVSNPAKILDELNKRVSHSLQNAENYVVNDGMDVCLISVDEMGNVCFAGARRPIFIVRDNEILEIKGDQQSIGSFSPDLKYTSHEFENQNYSMIYLTSDGFADQNNNENKKYSTKKLKNLLYLLSQKGVEEQLTLVNQEFEKHIGNERQRDDITIIGLRI
ncbi:MAG: SpoIIE family protein phosphatase [Candidatus Kapabacteria bacterium]|nr:SpoIIE family protein phosphatase [Candidatus Kapabacteria bacterium]